MYFCELWPRGFRLLNCSRVEAFIYTQVMSDETRLNKNDNYEGRQTEPSPVSAIAFTSTKVSCKISFEDEAGCLFITFFL